MVIHAGFTQPSPTATNTAVFLGLSFTYPRIHLLDGVRANAAGGVVNEGLRVLPDDAPIRIVDSVLSGGEGPGQNYGLHVMGSLNSEILIDRSTLVGSSASLATDLIPEDATFHVGGSKLVGPVITTPSATNELVCAAVYDENYSFYANDCPL